MTKQILTIVFALFLFSAHTLLNDEEKKPELAEPFETATVIFEQNATDGDVEVVFEVKGGDEGLLKLKITDPHDRVVVDFTAPEAATKGIRSFRMESPEPKNIKALKKAYPSGIYKFTATDSDGEDFRGSSSLSHDLPAEAEFKSPEEDADDVPVKGAKIAWAAMEDIETFIVEVEIEDEDRSDNVKAVLPGTTTSFSVPEGFLLPGREYKVSIGTVSEEGNMTFVEIPFSTAK